MKMYHKNSLTRDQKRKQRGKAEKLNQGKTPFQPKRHDKF